MTRVVARRLTDRWTLGMMSGTSLDGVDLSLVKFGRDYSVSRSINTYFKFSGGLRQEVYRIASDDRVSKSDLMSADMKLGQFYAKSARRFLESAEAGGIKPDLVGCHGQTVFHLAPAGKRTSWGGLSLQIGSPDAIAQELGVPVISDFRTADLAAGGRGAPLTPIAHQLFFGLRRTTQLVVNVGGISNVTFLGDAKDIGDVAGTDCGPGNMLIDGACRKLLGKPYDRGGSVALRGYVNDDLLDSLKAMPFLSRRIPFALGREQFGDDVLEKILSISSKLRLAPENVLATLTFFTAYCIRRVGSRLGNAGRVLICGGGAHNVFLRNALEDLFKGAEVVDTGTEGVDPDFVESISFALFANLVLDRKAANLPRVTGARRSVLLGKITLV